MAIRVAAARSRGTRLLCIAIGSATLTAAGLASAPAGNATCASFFGIGNSASCTSNLTSVAVAIGPNAQAHAAGLFGTAIAIGDGAESAVHNGSVFNVATVVGDNSSSDAAGFLSAAMTFGSKSVADAGGTAQLANIALAVGNGQGGAAAKGYGNVAVNILTLGDIGGASAEGILNIAVNAFGSASSTTVSAANAIGMLNGAVTLFGRGNQASAGLVSSKATGSLAFVVGGSSNTVTAGPGPFAIAGSVGQHHSTVAKVGPGININGVVVGGAAAVEAAAAHKPVVHTGTATARSARKHHPNGA
ncbi:hypothetical protein FEG63_06615 [Mycolicibacterium sphagni]|uniref:Uncharacterized protein n=1 Tax=Mycolicibacterium sphagni TaxID=1786 RepID=A0ABX2JUT1_9MYCO|nr:hypothetical protein [Mycolicibacterium sphagni]